MRREGPGESGRRLHLVFVAFHPEAEETKRLWNCLKRLPDSIGWAVVCNSHRTGEPVEALEAGSDLFLRRPDNLGYGRAINLAVWELQRLGLLAPYVGALNTDLSWDEGTFERMLAWLEDQPDVVMAVPRIISPGGEVQRLCKLDPTLLALLSRRFLPDVLKPAGLRRYDRRYVMADRDLHLVFEVPYLSGCCMLIRTSSFLEVGGFDEHFFLYLEDADLTRRMRELGRTVHLPVASVVHAWGRGNHRSWWLTMVNFHSAWLYFRKWGLRLI